MKPADLNIHVPAEIVAVPDLSLPERVVLATILERPGVANGSLAKLLGCSVRGVEALLARLRKRGLLLQIQDGHSREHRLTPLVATHKKCEISNSGNSDILCGPPPSPLPSVPSQSIEDAVEQDLLLAQSYVQIGSIDEALNLYRRVRERIQAEPDLNEDGKRDALAVITGLENRAVALNLAVQVATAKGLSRSKGMALIGATMKLSPEKLAEIRRPPACRCSG